MIEIKSLPALYVVGKKVQGNWKRLGTEMPKAWREVMERREEISHRTSPYILDICLHLRHGIFTQLVGVEVERLASIPAGLEGVTIPTQRYISMKYAGPITEIAGAFQDMMEWANKKGYTLDKEDFKIQYTPENEAEGYDLYYKIL
ncbi:GyrI-like domain-containing protein [Ectobacillus sp. JY-23]|uniref:GyrI-like domain-containing protein n=1 Tax=Ectobacillus sp. JY-23 TaxID=2933872 RepID=UPI001FF35F8F|nr:GyrI-like domain-containing protein [Ectobacillus sp. JY-23]UOY92414.1 GyrI-like domain-containing protein [Ectobacillus sp. JY-23]